MSIITKILLGIIFLVILFFILTIGDGKYTSKKLMYLVYNTLGPKIYSLESEKEKWQSIYKKLNIDPASVIIDVGTAAGDLPISLAQIKTHSGKIYGIDWSQNMVLKAESIAKKKGVANKVEFKRVDLRNGLPFNSKTFDVIFCIGLLEGYHKYQELIAELVRVVRDNGKIVLGLYNTGVKITQKNYKKELSKYGFTRTSVIDFRRTHSLLVAENSKTSIS